ncbi:hypothetical protein PBY51_009727 [Eleginops maclovinus]|uniref:Fusion protein IQCJ-SCHIP1 N-terminal domain-containing protein n=1 Tax=Eleginops maclovinus TaxID=56733 RepID=A0AAN8AV70_ELEMC|nr:hypothetical protein PBY51_009727 [Eleginops maclovinus]
MLRNGTYRSMYQGEEARLRSGTLAVARERKHLALCINNQEEVKRYHRYCNHSGGQAVPKMERSRPRRSEEEDDNSPRHREQQKYLEINAIVIQRAWRASTSRRESRQGQGESHGSQSRGETVPSEGLQEPVVTTDLSPEQLKSLQSGFKHVNDGGFQLQSDHLTMDLDNNININMPPIETKVLIIQRAWRDFLQRQEAEKRSPSPPSLSSSDKMSMSISMTTLSDGSTPTS